MIGRLTLFLSLLSLAACQTAQTVILVNESQLERGRFYFDCDAAAGRTSGVSQQFNAAIPGLRGVLSLNELRRHERWQPLVSVHFRDADDRIVVGVFLTADQGDEHLRSGIVVGDGPERFERKYLPVAHPAGKPLPFIVRIDSDAAYIAVGDESTPFKVPIAGEAVKMDMSCSTAWAEISIN